jgi:hypothetical protein
MIELIKMVASTPTQISPGFLPDSSANSDTIKSIIQIVFAILGALALLMITISGLRYVLSAGDPQKASKARDGLIYALVGLTIAVAAESIVAFIGGSL